MQRPERVDVQYRYEWRGDDGPIGRTVGDDLRARATDLTVTVFPSGDLNTKLEGRVIRADGTRDRRFTYRQLMWDIDEVTAFVEAEHDR